jgi:hypothetical protein
VIFSFIFAANRKRMTKATILLNLIEKPLLQYFQTGWAPIDDNLHLIILFVLLTIVFGVVYLVKKIRYSNWFSNQKVRIEIGKSRLYYPEFVKLTVTNTGNTDIDFDRPLLIFDNWWMKRKFRISGVEGRNIYPLYLEKGKTHSLNIDLSPFYGYDRKLKGYPKIRVSIFNIKGKYLGGHAVYLRKTLIKF